MRVAFDAQLTVGTATGIGTYQRELAAALTAAGLDIVMLANAGLDPWRFDRRVLWDQIMLPAQTARSGAALLHATAGTLPLLRTMPAVVTIHDLAWLRVQQHTRSYARAYFGALQRRLARGADAIIADSAFTAAEIAELIAPRAPVHVVHLGVGEERARAARTPRHIAPFALVTGTVERRKNLGAIVEALPQLPRLRVVSIGPLTPYARDVARRAAELGVDDRLELRGYVEPAERARLEAEATLALVPSRYEGFGYALADALVGGIPVIAARSSSLVEVAGGDAVLVDPDDTAGWTHAIAALLADPGAAEQRAAALRVRSAARFAWPLCAQATRAVYASVAS